jgi:hypothetical protein
MADARFWRLVRHLCRCGERAVGELFREVIEARTAPAELEARLESYARLDPDVLRALGADKAPGTMLHVVTSK